MHRTTLALLLLTPFASPAAAQNAYSFAVRMKNGGVLHMQDGTWEYPSADNPDPGSDVGSVVYANDAQQNYYMVADPVTEWYDFGRLPSATSPPPEQGTLSAYRVTGFQFAYCTKYTRGNFQYILAFYDNYEPCLANADREQTARFVLSDLPGAPAIGEYTTWMVTIDLREGDEFCMRADGGNMTYDGNVLIDSFAWSINTPTVHGGPVLAGDPTGTFGPAAAYGDGTVWHGNVGVPGTGLDTEDQVAKRDFGLPPDKCHTITNEPQTYSSFHLKLYADLNAPPCGSTFSESLGSNYCDPGSRNSTGRSGLQFATGSTAVADNEFTLWATQLPVSRNPAVVLMGTGQDLVHPTGSAGPMCVGGGELYRLPLLFTDDLPGGFRTRVDFSSPFYGNLIKAGETWNFQTWYRDGMGPSRMTNALTVTFD